MAGNDDFFKKFRAGFKGTSKEKEGLEMQEEAQKRARKKKEKDKPSMFSKIYDRLRK